MKKNVLVIIVLVLTMDVFAQSLNQCAFDEVVRYFNDSNGIFYAQQNKADIVWWNYWRSKNNSNFNFGNESNVQRRSSCVKARLIIPVAIHVVHNGGSENIGYLQAQNAIENLNKHFANGLGVTDPLAVNTGIQFTLVKFDKVQSSLTIHRKIKQTGQLMGLKMSNTDTFINIWVVKQILDTAGKDIGVMGYSTYPGRVFAGGKQGIVIRFDWFGKADPNFPINSESRGDFLTHEIGHYLGLYHPFEGGCAGLKSSTAYSEGDYCLDVPAVSYADTNCLGNNNSCVEEYKLLSYGVNPPDQKQLFMDYSSPHCKTSFTNDQTRLMYARIEQYHPSLGNPMFIPKGYPNSCISVARIVGIMGGCKGDSIKLQTYNLDSTGSKSQYVWKLFKRTTLIATGANKFEFKYCPDTGKYTVCLQVTINGISTYDTLRDLVEIFNCLDKIRSTKGNWYMGSFAGISFMKSQTIRDLGPFIFQKKDIPNLNTAEGTMCMSDSNGKLLFYGGVCPPNLNNTYNDGPFRIFGKNYLEISGSPLIASATAGQGPIAIPVADSSGKFMVFYVPFRGPYLKYSKLDVKRLSIRNGKDSVFGAVVSTDSFVFDTIAPNRLMGEALTVIPKCDPKNFWLLCHVVYDSMYYRNNSGRILVFDYSNNRLKFHSQLIIPQTYYENFLTVNSAGSIIHFDRSLYQFDKVTGNLTFWKNLASDSCDFTWSAMWSSDGKRLFRTEGYNNKYGVYQYDIENTSSLMGRILITETNSERVMQLGPDKKIYLATENQPYLSEIGSPDSLNFDVSNRVGYKPVGVLLKTGQTGGVSNAYSMPNLINAEPEIINRLKISFLIFQSNCFNVKTVSSIKCASTWKWLWGDGTVSNSEEGQHIYNATGIYEISLVINGVDTVRRKVNIGILESQRRIIGPSDTVCTSSVNEYFVPLHKDFEYTWKTLNSNSQTNDENRAYIQWKEGLGSLKLILLNRSTGCIDSNQKNILRPSQIQNNIIDSSQIVCDVSNLTNIKGRTLTGGTGTYSYEWYYKKMGDSFLTVFQGENSSGVDVKREAKNYSYLRKVKSGICYSWSNEVKKIVASNNFLIKTKDSACFKIFEIDSFISFSGLSYQWELSSDSISFNEINGDTINRIEIKNISNTCFYRLKIKTLNCSLYSNILKHNSSIEFITQPHNAISCGLIPFLMKPKINSLVNLKYQWEYKTEAVSSPFGAWVNWNSKTDDSLLEWATNFNGKSRRLLRLKVTSPCGVKYSDSAEVVMYASPAIVSTDTNKIVSSGTPVKLQGHWVGERNISYAIWQRSTNPTGSRWDSLGMTDGDSFFVTPVFTNCQRRLYYRVVIRNLCPSNPKYTWQDRIISDCIDVGTYEHPQFYHDLWSPDSKRDNGVEPNIVDSVNFTGSPYLWNRYNSNKYTRVWDWVDRSDIQSDRDTNFIHLMVLNRGQIPATNAKIYFYWTVMSVNEDWPYSWTGKAMFKNKDSYSQYNNMSFPLGGRINKTGIELSTFLNSDPKYGGQLIPNDSVIITYPWVQSDTVPKAGWYYGIVNKKARYANHIGLCILARIQECDSPNYALSYPEKINLNDNNVSNNVNYRGNLGYNILKNNNIVSENFYLGYMSPPFSDTIQVWTLSAMKKREGFPMDSFEQRIMRFNFCADNPLFFNSGEVVMTLEDAFIDLLASQNFPGQGYTVNTAKNQLIINSPCAELGPFYTSDTFSTSIGLSWRYMPSSDRLGPITNTLFTLKEYVEQEFIGSTQYGIKSHQNSNNGNNNSGYPGDMPVKENETPSSNQYCLTVKPNPFEDKLYISFSGIKNSSTLIELTDVLGRFIGVICECKTDDTGRIQINVETEGLKPGVYCVRVKHQDKWFYYKIIKA